MVANPQPTPSTRDERRAFLATVSEAQFQDAVLQLARYSGWKSYHTHDSRRSDPGWPDLVLCRPPRLVIAELKTQKGRVKPEQNEWLALLTGCTGVEVYLWRPGDWPHIEATLK